MKRVLLPQVVVVTPRQKNPHTISIHHVGGLAAVAVEKSGREYSQKDGHRPICQTQLQTPDLEHEMSPVHVVDNHQKPQIQGNFRRLIVTPSRHHHQVRGVSGSAVKDRPNESVHRSIGYPKALHAHQPFFAVCGLVERIVFDESEKVRYKTGQDDVGKLIGTNAAISKARATHDLHNFKKSKKKEPERKKEREKKEKRSAADIWYD